MIFVSIVGKNMFIQQMLILATKQVLFLDHTRTVRIKGFKCCFIGRLWFITVIRYKVFMEG